MFLRLSQGGAHQCCRNGFIWAPPTLSIFHAKLGSVIKVKPGTRPFFFSQRACGAPCKSKYTWQLVIGEEAGGVMCAVGPEVCECCGKVWVENLRNITTVVLYSFFNREAYTKMAVVRLKEISPLIETYVALLS